MIVLDSSALMAVVFREAAASACIERLMADTARVISAVTMAEALIVAGRRGVGEEMTSLIEKLGCDVSPVSETVARRAAEAYAQWGKGRHPAALNFADCFSYVAARERDCPLLFVGDDFSKTDVKSAL